MCAFCVSVIYTLYEWWWKKMTTKKIWWQRYRKESIYHIEWIQCVQLIRFNSTRKKERKIKLNESCTFFFLFSTISLCFSLLNVVVVFCLFVVYHWLSKILLLFISQEETVVNDNVIIVYLSVCFCVCAALFCHFLSFMIWFCQFFFHLWNS